MDLVTHEGFPTSPTGKANKEIQHPNLFFGWLKWKFKGGLKFVVVKNQFRFFSGYLKSDG